MLCAEKWVSQIVTMITWNTKISIDEMLVQIKSEYIMSMFGFLDFCETPDWPDFFIFSFLLLTSLDSKAWKDQ